MAGYATTGQVASEFKTTTFTSTTAVTDTEIAEWSEQFSRMLDGYLAKKYTVPVTDTDGANVCSLMVRSLVAARAARVLNATNAIGESELNNAIAKENFVYKWLKDLQAGKVELEGATLASRLSPKSYNQANAKTPTWEIDTDQW